MLDQWLQKSHPLSPLLVEASHLDADAMARFFATLVKPLLCVERKACGICPICKKLNKGYHPDWISLVEAPSMEEIRKALQQIRYQPFEAKFRVLSIAGFGAANRSVQNACLKTLEEPSAYWIILLGTQSRETVLDTVRSRSLFSRVPEKLKVELTNGEENLFNSITSRDELKVQSEIENRLKDREQSRDLFSTLLRAASERQYPGHWKNLAPWLEESLVLLSRNLNPKTLWDRSWALSMSRVVS